MSADLLDALAVLASPTDTLAAGQTAVQLERLAAMWEDTKYMFQERISTKHSEPGWVGWLASSKPVKPDVTNVMHPYIEYEFYTWFMSIWNDENPQQKWNSNDELIRFLNVEKRRLIARFRLQFEFTRLAEQALRTGRADGIRGVLAVDESGKDVPNRPDLADPTTRTLRIIRAERASKAAAYFASLTVEEERLARLREEEQKRAEAERTRLQREDEERRRLDAERRAKEEEERRRVEQQRLEEERIAAAAAVAATVAVAKKKAEEEAAAKKKAEEEAVARKKAEEEAAAKKKAEDEAARKRAEASAQSSTTTSTEGRAPPPLPPPRAKEPSASVVVSELPAATTVATGKIPVAQSPAERIASQGDTTFIGMHHFIDGNERNVAIAAVMFKSAEPKPDFGKYRIPSAVSLFEKKKVAARVSKDKDYVIQFGGTKATAIFAFILLEYAGDVSPATLSKVLGHYARNTTIYKGHPLLVDYSKAPYVNFDSKWLESGEATGPPAGVITSLKFIRQTPPTAPAAYKEAMAVLMANVGHFDILLNSLLGAVNKNVHIKENAFCEETEDDDTEDFYAELDDYIKNRDDEGGGDGFDALERALSVKG